jgi:glycerophosphoryl diester phosphodiesterase
VYWLLLTDHDINFYLADKPPRFWLAISLIGADLFVMAGLMLKKITGWAFATQLLLYEKLSPGNSLKESQQRALGHRLTIARAFVAWAIFNVAVGVIVSMVVIESGRLIVPMATGSLWMLIFTVGLVMMLAAIANLLTSLWSSVSFASLLGLLYLKLAAQGEVSLPEVSEQSSRLSLMNFTRRRMLVFSVIFSVISGLVGATAMHSMKLEDRVEITAHRGGAGIGPENTLAAIRQSIEDGTDWIEIDVQESRDGIVVVAHDSDLARVAGNPVKIWEATADELRSIDIGSYFGPQFKSERVPTLEEVLQACKGKARVNIELKYYGHTQDLENRVIELVERLDMESEIVVMSLESKGIEKMKSLRPEWNVGLLTAVAAGDLTRAKADFLAVNSSIASHRFIQAAHNRDKTVSAWTVNDGYAMSAMISRGVDNLITDYPDVARSVLAERQGMSPLERLMIELAFYLGVKPPAGG